MLYRIFVVVPVYCHITDGLIGTRKHWRGAAGTVETARNVIRELSEWHDPEDHSFSVTKDGKEVVWWESTPLTPAAPTPDLNDPDCIPF